MWTQCNTVQQIGLLSARKPSVHFTEKKSKQVIVLLLTLQKLIWLIYVHRTCFISLKKLIFVNIMCLYFWVRMWKIV